MNKLRIRLLSDIHSEFDKPEGSYIIEPTKYDSDSVLLLGGDIGLSKFPDTLEGIFQQASKQFFQTFYVMGNHEHYNGSFVQTKGRILKMLEKYNTIHLLDNNSRIVQDVVFIGCSLWTSFDNESFAAMFAARTQINDYHIIKTGINYNSGFTRKLMPEDTVSVHKKSREYLFRQINLYKQQGKKVVVLTHHGPSYKSISKKYISNELLNHSYVSDLEDLIVDNEPDIWCHGHIHTSFDYNIGKTRVLVNPRGYYGREVNPEFDPFKYFEI